MEGNKSPSRKRPNPQFTGNGGSKRGRQDTTSDSSDTVYRILCQCSNIGSVIGKRGSRVKALREETRATITIADTVFGSDERVILIHSPAKIHERDNGVEDQEQVSEKEDVHMKPHCPAQDALLKVHERIIEEALAAGTGDGETVVTARLLVPINVVGCILGKKGDVIQKLRSDTGANIRVLPAEHLPPCAHRTDELVQISGKPGLVKTALYEISTLLHQSPKKDTPILSYPMPDGTQGLRPPGPPVDIPPPGIPTWSHRHSNPRDMPPVPWEGGYRMDDFSGEVPSEFSMKIVCPAGKIGAVIGKGGANVKRLQQETGATIKVEDVLEGSEERIICISSYEHIRNPQSPTIEAILHLQDQTSETKEIITTRLLVQSNKVGCILGQGGHIINQMRHRTMADIRVQSKKDKPKYAGANEELVQIAGNFNVAKKALVEIASRLRERYLREAIIETELAPIRPFKGFDPDGNIPRRVSHGPGSMRGDGSSSRYEFVKGGRHEYELADYPIPPSATRYSNISSVEDMDMPKDAAGYGVGRRGGNIPEIAGRRPSIHDSPSGGSRGIPEYRGSAEHFSAAQNYPRYMGPSEENWNPPPQGSRQHDNTQQGTFLNDRPQPPSYQNMNTPQTQQYPYPSNDNPHRPYENVNAEKSPYADVHAPRQPYQDIHAQRQPYQDAIAQRQPYQDSHAQRQPYQDAIAPRQPYQDAIAPRQPYQDGHAQRQPYEDSRVPRQPYQDSYAPRQPYQDVNAEQGPYQNAGAQGPYRY